MKKIALFGITANPMHCGHLNAIEQLISNFDLFIVHLSAASPWKNGILDFDTRLLMAQNLVNEKNVNSKIIISQIEAILLENKKENKDSKIYTYEVAKYFKEKYFDSEISLIFGQDNINNVKKFKEYNYLNNNFKFVFANEEKNMHSSHIRDYFKNNLEEKFKNQIIDFIGKSNYNYIKENNIYKD